MKKLFSNLIIALASSVFTFFIFSTYYQPEPIIIEKAPAKLIHQPEQAFVNEKPLNRHSALLPDFTSVSKKTTASVVNITAYSSSGYRVSSGSGVIITSNGYIVTNNHVIEKGSSIKVSLLDKRKYSATLIGHDPMTDLAVLKISASGLKALSFGNSDQVEVGQWALAVGNPFNLNSTVTAGIVSAKARNIDILDGSYSIESFIQTDAVVNPGNSGGALVNSNGELIGINAAIISETGAYAGYSFAIPANLVKKVAEDIREFGKVKRAILGVNIRDVTDEIASDLKLPSVSGVYVFDVNRGSSADNAGIRSGDVIIGVNGYITNSVPELQEQIALYRPGDNITLDYFRNGNRYSKERIRLQPMK